MKPICADQQSKNQALPNFSPTHLGLRAALRRSIPLTLACLTGGHMEFAKSMQFENYLAVAPHFETDPNKGRDFRSVSIHPNGKDLVLVECSKALDRTGGCYVLRYDLEKQILRRYELPSGYFYIDAKFSPSGKLILMARVPKNDGSEADIIRSYEKSELVLMDTEGSNFRILKAGDGYKTRPTMNQSETKISYWRSAIRPSGSRSRSSKFDIWEFDTINNSDNLYSGPFKFFTSSNLQYISDDKIIAGAGGPEEFAEEISAYTKKYNDSAVYSISRGAKQIPEPILTEVSYANYPSLDIKGNLYFSGDRPNSSFFRMSSDKNLVQWAEPISVGIGGVFNVTVAPDGSYIVFTYGFKGIRPNEGRRGLGVLVTGTSKWTALSVPLLEASLPIAVKK